MKFLKKISFVYLLLFLSFVFTIIKLCGLINWSWWWVFAPIWLPLSVVVFIIIILGLLIFTIDNTQSKKNEEDNIS